MLLLEGNDLWVNLKSSFVDIDELWIETTQFQVAFPTGHDCPDENGRPDGHLQNIFLEKKPAVFNVVVAGDEFGEIQVRSVLIDKSHIGMNETHRGMFIEDADFMLQVFRQHNIIVVQDVHIVAVGEFQTSVGIAHEPQVGLVA